MEIDPKSLSIREVYGLMTSCIVPRPVAWVSTIAASGARNLAPFSYFMGVGSSPPMLAVSIGWRKGEPKDTARNIKETGDFVVNVATAPLVEQMVATSGEYPPDVDEFTLAKLTPTPSAKVKSPGVLESPLRMECILVDVIKPGANPTDLILGEIIHFHVDDQIVSEGLPAMQLLRPIARLGKQEYAELGPAFTFDRPRG